MVSLRIPIYAVAIHMKEHCVLSMFREIINSFACYSSKLHCTVSGARYSSVDLHKGELKYLAHNT